MAKRPEREDAFTEPTTINESFLTTWANEPDIDPDRFDTIAANNVNIVVPALPEVPNWKLGWISVPTESNGYERGTMMKGRAAGWKPITAEELAVYDAELVSLYRVKQGPVSVIQIKDLLACKIPLPLWRRHREKDMADERSKRIDAIKHQNPLAQAAAHWNYRDHRGSKTQQALHEETRVRMGAAVGSLKSSTFKDTPYDSDIDEVKSD